MRQQGFLEEAVALTFKSCHPEENACRKEVETGWSFLTVLFN